MITLTGTTLNGQQVSADVPYLLFPEFDAAILKGVSLRPGDLVFAAGPLRAYSARASDEQLHAAGVLATRVLRRHLSGPCEGEMRLAGHIWTHLQSVTLDQEAVRSVQHEQALRDANDEDQDEA